MSENRTVTPCYVCLLNIQTQHGHYLQLYTNMNSEQQQKTKTTRGIESTSTQKNENPKDQGTEHDPASSIVHLHKVLQLNETAQSNNSHQLTRIIDQITPAGEPTQIADEFQSHKQHN